MIEISSRNESNNLFTLSFVVELRNGEANSTSGSIGCYLSKVNNPFSRLSVAQNGTVSFSSKSPGKAMMLTLEVDNEGEQLYYIRSACIKHQEKCLLSSPSTKAVNMFYSLVPCFETNELRTSASAKSFKVRILSSNPYSQTTILSSHILPPTPHVQASAPANTRRVEGLDVGRVSCGKGLTAAQRLFFRTHGYLHLREVIDAPVQNSCLADCAPMRSNFIARAICRINHALGTPHELTPGGNQMDESLGKLGGSVSNCKEIRQLVEPSYANDNYPFDLVASTASIHDGDGVLPPHPATDYYRSHLKLRCVLADIFGGEDNIPSASSLGAQIACRFPENYNEVNCADAPPTSAACTDGSTYFSQSRNAYVSYPPLSLTDWHVDGMRQGSRHSFSILMGVCCSAVSTPFSGNLVLWPGSHKLIHR
jgi:hypothetical protein